MAKNLSKIPKQTCCQVWFSGSFSCSATCLTGLLTFLFMLLMPCICAASAEKNGLILLTPESGSIILSREGITHLVFRAPSSDDNAGITLKSSQDTYTPSGSWAIQGRDYIHFRLPLTPGNNSYTLMPADLPVHLKFRQFRSMLTLKPDAPGVFLFHRQDDLQAECRLCHTDQSDSPQPTTSAGCNSFSPGCYSCHRELISTPDYLHAPSVDMLCLACHQEGPETSVISFPRGRMDQFCLKCHNQRTSWLSKQHIHGPVGSGDCSVCHNPHGDRYPFQLWAEPTTGLCVACHTDKKKLSLERSAGFFSHGILKGNGCVICHDPHAGNNRFQLHRPINALCTSCHISIDPMNREHPVKGHPVQGVKDPRRPERDFSCTSCHNPHGSMFRFLLIGDVLGGHVCSQCHVTTNENKDVTK